MGIEASAQESAPGLNGLGASPTLHHREIYLDGLRIHVVEAGDPTAPAVVLVHGWLASSASMAVVQAQLAARYHVVAYDAAGFGDSARPWRRVDGGYQGKVLAGLLDALDLRDVVVVGQSMGALGAVHGALRSPRVGQVVLCNPAGFRVEPLRRMGMTWLFAPRVYATAASWTFHIPAHLVTVTWKPGVARDLEQQLRRRDDPGWCQAAATAYAAVGSGELSQAAARLQVPVTFLFGDDDMALTRGYQENALAVVPGARAVRLPACGHDAHHDDPTRFVQAVSLVRAGQPLPAVLAASGTSP